MLLRRREMSYDFGQATFDVSADRELLRWVFSQLLYGQVQAVQAGRRIPEAPDLDSARFVAKRCLDDHDAVRDLVRVFDRLRAEPGEPHRLVRLLSLRSSGGGWEEHVALELAQGQGLVLSVLYGLLDTVEDPVIHPALERITAHLEGVVEFGERATIEALAHDPGLARRLAGLHLLHLYALRIVAEAARAIAPRRHPVLRQVPYFLYTAAAATETRLLRLGLVDRPPSALGRRQTVRLVAEAYLLRWSRRLVGRRRPELAARYLDDPVVRGGEIPWRSRIR